MRVLLSGGKKTYNIIEGIRKKFTTSGDDFVVIEYLDDIMDMFSRGDYFDKAVIIEQSITRDGAITDEMVIRQRINKFSTDISTKVSKGNYVFLSQEQSIASMIYDEILDIANDSAIVFMKPPYKATFFADLIVKEAAELPREWVFEPELYVPEVEDFGFNEGDAPSDIDTYGMELGLDLQEMPDNDLFDDGEDFGRFSDELSIDQGYDAGNFGAPDNLEDMLGGSNEQAFENTDGFGFGGFDDVFDGGFDETQQDWTSSGNSSNSSNDFDYSYDESIETNVLDPIKQSSELPDYTEQSSSLYGETGNGFGEDMYGQQSNFEKQDDFSNEMYASEQSTNDMQGFGGDMYSDETQDDYQVNMENDMYGNPAGFDQQSYDRAAEASRTSRMTNMEENNLNSQVPKQTMQVQRRKGIRGLFGKGQNNQEQYENVGSQLNNAQPVQTWKQDTQAMVNKGKGSKKVNVDSIKQQLRPFASRGNNILVTGCGGCGTSTVAYNLANIINQLGYTVLLVDMDTQGRTQSYISKTNYDSIEPDGANLMSAVNSSNGINAQEAIVKQGFHLLTMGLGTDTAPVSELLHKEKISRFVNLAKTSHNFVIYDIPFDSATGFLSEITYMTDNLVLVADASNWGITKLMLNVCNISLDDMQDTIFSRAQLVFNRYRNLNKLLGKKVRTAVDITKVVDMKVQELIGEDPGFHFEDLHIAGIINDDPDIENGWFDTIQYSDINKGQAIFLELLENIVLKK